MWVPAVRWAAREGTHKGCPDMGIAMDDTTATRLIGMAVLTR
ncbi:MAG: hypothetical protein U0470_03330 [Anaerolineae bacterium]